MIEALLTRSRCAPGAENGPAGVHYGPCQTLLYAILAHESFASFARGERIAVILVSSIVPAAVIAGDERDSAPRADETELHAPLALVTVCGSEEVRDNLMPDDVAVYATEFGVNVPAPSVDREKGEQCPSLQSIKDGPFVHCCCIVLQ